MTKPRLLLAGDHDLMVEIFTKLSEAAFDVVGTVADGPALLKKAPALKPDVIILDLELPELNRRDTGKQLKKLLPQTKIVVLALSDNFEFAAQALRHWASAYVLKNSTASELTRAIREVLKDRIYVTAKVAQRMLEEFVHNPNPDHEGHLTKRQKEVLQLLAEGRTMRQVGGMLEISARTVAFHKYRIMQEHGLKTQSDLVIFAIKQRVLAPPI